MKEKSVELGFGQISFLPVQPLPLWDEGIQARKLIDPDTADYWDVRGLSSDCKAVMDDAKTMIAALYPYQPYKESFTQGHGHYSAHYSAYTKGRDCMTELASLLTDNGYRVAVDPPVPAKQIAYQGGLGKFGKNGLIHHPKYGSFMTLHILLTNVDLEPDKIQPGEISDCGNCRICMDACPMQAISQNGVVIISKCIRYYMLSSDIIPIGIRKKMGARIIGCEDCQITCPKNRKVVKQAVQQEQNQQIFDIKDILANYKAGLKKNMEPIGERIGKNYARPLRILSMAIIAAGNSNDSSYVPLLKETLHHPYPAIRAHSAWAIGKLGGINAKEMILAVQQQEQNPEVQMDINLAVQRIDEDSSMETW